NRVCSAIAGCRERHVRCAGCSGDLLTASPPGEKKTTARQDQARKSSTDDGTRNRNVVYSYRCNQRGSEHCLLAFRLQTQLCSYHKLSKIVISCVRPVGYREINTPNAFLTRGESYKLASIQSATASASHEI